MKEKDEKYEPKKWEVFKEVARGAKDSLSRENISNYEQSIKEFGTFALGVPGVLTFGMHFAPTAYRLGVFGSDKDPVGNDVKKHHYTKAETLGLVTGFVNTVAVGFIYLYPSMSGEHFEIMLVPVATNAVSLAYEKARSSYMSAKDRLVEKYASNVEEYAMERGIRDE